MQQKVLKTSEKKKLRYTTSRINVDIYLEYSSREKFPLCINCILNSQLKTDCWKKRNVTIALN